jgi:hypothetical protein
MKMISPSNREVDVGKTLSETEWIGMCRREVFDEFLRKRAKSLGANIVNGLMMKMEMPQVRAAGRPPARQLAGWPGAPAAIQRSAPSARAAPPWPMVQRAAAAPAAAHLLLGGKG